MENSIVGDWEEMLGDMLRKYRQKYPHDRKSDRELLEGLTSRRTRRPENSSCPSSLARTRMG